MNPLCPWKALSYSCVLVAISISSFAQTFTRLASLGGVPGSYPWGPLVQTVDGSFYGTAFGGSLRNSGSIFRITSTGQLSLRHYFCSRADCADGANPAGPLETGCNGAYHGITNIGGTSGRGTVFEINEKGTVFTLHTFEGPDGENPDDGVIQAADENYYGTTLSGGTGSGTVFKLSPAGTFTTLHNFSGDDGEGPRGLVQGADGNLYGISTLGGDFTDCVAGCGTVFKITPSGVLTVLHLFNGADGSYPYGAMVQGANGNFYGTTSTGGLSGSCCGTVFEITPAGTLTTLHEFDGTDGGGPEASLILASDGNLYGSTDGINVGSDGPYMGTIFQITPAGSLRTLHVFSGPDGDYPVAPLLQATDGNFYGTTLDGGMNHCTGYLAPGCGTVFKLSMGLGPFVAAVPDWGKIGHKITILGSNLKGATSVTFDGIEAAFTVASATEIQTTVPAGAKTGRIRVVTANRILSSDIAFLVVR